MCCRCGTVVMRGEWCVCIRSIHTIIGKAKTARAKDAAATPPLSSLIFRLLGWREKRPRDRFIRYQEVARMPEHQPDFRLVELTRANVGLDMLCAYVFVPLFGILTLCAGVFLTLFSVIPIMDLMLKIIHHNVF